MGQPTREELRDSIIRAAEENMTAGAEVIADAVLSAIDEHALRDSQWSGEGRWIRKQHIAQRLVSVDGDDGVDFMLDGRLVAQFTQTERPNSEILRAGARRDDGWRLFVREGFEDPNRFREEVCLEFMHATASEIAERPLSLSEFAAQQVAEYVAKWRG